MCPRAHPSCWAVAIQHLSPTSPPPRAHTSHPGIQGNLNALFSLLLGVWGELCRGPGSPCQMMNQLVLQWEPAQTGWARVEEDRGAPGSIASPSVIHTGPISKSASCMYGARHCHLMSGWMMLGDQAVFTACSSLEQSVARVLEGRQSSMPSRPLPKPSGRMTEVYRTHSNGPSLYLWVPLCPH